MPSPFFPQTSAGCSLPLLNPLIWRGSSDRFMGDGQYLTDAEDHCSYLGASFSPRQSANEALPSRWGLFLACSFPPAK